jgi:hypothetical protein
MVQVPIDQLAAGLKTARPVTTPSGLTLVGEGTVLTVALIARLKGLGVIAVAVAGDAGVARASVEDRLAALAARFTRHAGDPLMTALHDLLAADIRRSSHGS